MEIEETALAGAVILTPARHQDSRGFFSESWSKKAMAAAGFEYDFVQDNHSMSHASNTLRGLHYQEPPHGQVKLVRCGQGSFFDVAVDIRRGSPTYGHWIGVELSAKNGKQLLIPEGFLHGFVTRTPDTEVIYKCSRSYAPAADGAVHWDSCGIEWGLKALPLLSDKDAIAPRLSDFESPF